MFLAPPIQRIAGNSAGPRILAQIAAICLMLLVILTPTVAGAADPAPDAVHYTVTIDAPEPLDVLLERNLDLVRYRNDPDIDQEQLQRLIRAAPEQIGTLVATAGFYTPQVTVRLDAGSSTVIVTVTPGQPVRVGSVDLVLQGFAGSTPSDVAALKASWNLKQGAIFRQADWELAKRTLLRQVVQTRYPQAQLSETQAAVDPATQRAALRVVLDSGPEVRFGELRIEGLRRYPDAIVRNLNQIKAGDVYSEAALQAYQARLQDTGYFSSVEVSADLAGTLNETEQEAAPTTTPLTVRVTENKMKNVSVGLGYSTNTGNRAQLTYDDLSVFGLKMKNALTLETKKQSARSDFYFPTTSQGYKDSIGAGFERSDIANERTSVATVAAKRAWGSPLFERSLVFEFLNEIKTVQGAATSHSKSLPLTYGITRRRLDNLLFPTEGYVINAQLGGALWPVLTDEKFLRGSVRFIDYTPIGKKGSVILRGEGGALASKEKVGVPATYLFRAGGDQSVRGYAYQELGVREGDATVGGRYLASASFEYQYWFTPTWGGAAFYDAGNASDTIKDWHPKSGYGVGVRYKSPVGPINVDAAYGHATQRYRLHFSLGFTF